MVCNGDTKKKHTYTRNKERPEMVLFARNHARLVATHIAGLHVTSRRPCWWSRTKAFLSSGNETLFSRKFFEEIFFCFDPQHGRLFTWLQTKNKIPADLTWNHQPVNNYCKTCNNSRAISRGNITWDQAQFERFSYILSNGYFSFRLARRNVQSETKIEPDLRLGAIS